MCYSALVKRNLDYLNRRYGATWIREQIDDYLRLAALDPKKYPPPEERIFPGHYAPVIHLQGGIRQISLMRYGAYPQPTIQNPSRYTTYNARLDNLKSSFWSHAFMNHHGFVVLTGFYEWVAVKDLLKAGVVSLEEIKREFAKQSAGRRQRLESQGKKWKPTPTEQKDALERKVVIRFAPSIAEDLLAPVIFSSGKTTDGREDYGFAIVTDDPPLDVSGAGHDRCPVLLPETSLDAWLLPSDVGELGELALLHDKKEVPFQHKLDEVG